LLEEGNRLRVVDVRWYLDPTRSGRDAYRAGHIPGAVYLDAEFDLAGPGGARGGPLGRHPWPDAQQVERVMSSAGIDARIHVVVYDDQAGAVAARLWFLLRAYGHESASVLDGGIVKWQAEGRALSRDRPDVRPRTFVADPQPGMVLDKAAFLAERDGALVLDARAAERYRGEVEPIDPRAGHVPGARSAPFSGNLTGGDVPVFLPKEALRQRYASLGALDAEPIVYCGSGITACHDLLALHEAGIDGRLYSGSWSEWSSDPSLPIATGDEG
jgi:thiosulfate/3-mercaptopyruvate sulfurtransferase